MTKTVVVLGASYAGLKISHSLLKTTLPLVEGLKLYLVSPSTHAYFNLASPRAIIPGQIADDEVFAAIEPAFSKYPPSSFEFVLGRATEVDPYHKRVGIETESGIREINYDVLVVTTGSSSMGNMPWKSQGSHKDTREILHETQKQITSAKSIMVGGAGVTGVEVAGELGFEYGKMKDITLVCKDDVILRGFLGQKIGSNSLKELRNLKVKVVFKATITSAIPDSSGQTQVTLSTGEKKVVDLYLPCVGVRANSSFMPSDLLNTRGEITVDEFMAVKGAKDVWSCGDVAAIQANKFTYANEQAAHLARTLNLVLSGGSKPSPYKPNTTAMGAVIVGRRKGFGQVGWLTLPNFLIQSAKGKTFMVEKLPNVVNGSM